MSQSYEMAKLHLGSTTINVEGYVNYSIDKSYGEDADGNRGSVKTIVHNVDYIGACYEDGEEVVLGKVEREMACDRLANKFLEG